MEAELSSLKEHGTWHLVPRSTAGQSKVITCRWVFAIKRNEQGRIKRYKARLVVHGFKQVAGIDYGETYAPYDVKTAFLYGPLEEKIYMKCPDGYKDGSPAMVCELQDREDRGLYAKKYNGTITMLIMVYIDDLLLIGPGDLCKRMAERMKEDYQLTSLVDISIDQEKKRVTFSQAQYIREILRRFHMSACRVAKTPEPSGRLQVRKPEEGDPPPPFRELVGALGYLVMGTRPDIAHAVRRLGQYLASFDITHYELGKHVLRYLKATIDYGLVMDIKPEEVIEKSISGYVTLIDGNVISYGSRKQGMNAMSTTEAECVAMAEGLKDLM
ncbi:TPA: hypothetical protein N0F65_003853 [Lagenidium giganteum]|uniref:Reverse transcriptase Ty1/copia-type domain-containing protein n=1 Tax=Lagenidium giganteum TaxID=4803 RepID=A0AAV2YQF4_9STRA|nr:TPA: hypothetical protein N0F65_003853 [Lagenidium giganteum]